jgi:hypothetical protein
MLRFKNLIVSESVSVDKDTGNTSIFNIFSNVSAPAFPVVVNRIVVTLIGENNGGGNTEGVVELLIRQKGALDNNHKLPFASNDSQGVNLILKVNNFVIAGPGEIEFIAKIDNEEIRNTISVKQAGTKI